MVVENEYQITQLNNVFDWIFSIYCLFVVHQNAYYIFVLLLIPFYTLDAKKERYK